MAVTLKGQMLRFEAILKALDRMARNVRIAGQKCNSLDRKMQACKVQREIEEARRKLRVLYFDVQDVMIEATGDSSMGEYVVCQDEQRDHA